MPSIDDLVRQYHDEYFPGKFCGNPPICTFADLIRRVITDERERAAVIAEKCSPMVIGEFSGNFSIALSIAAAIRAGEK